MKLFWGLGWWALLCLILPVCLAIPPEVNIRIASGVWLRPDVLVAPQLGPTLSPLRFRLNEEGPIQAEIQPRALQQTLIQSPFAALAKKWPEYAQYQVLTVPLSAKEARKWIKGQILWGQEDVQIAPLLDSISAYHGTDLGVSWKNQQPRFRAWAPSAQQINLIVLQTDETLLASFPMESSINGTWFFEGQTKWAGLYYRYEVRAYNPHTGHVETHQTTDPYSLSLSADSQSSQIVRLDDPKLMPPHWQQSLKTHGKRLLPEAPEDRVIYELHLRDFSAQDRSIPQAYRGSYRAFTFSDSLGMRHLKRLSDAGLSHVHLLPVFDFGSVPERKHAQFQPDIPPVPPNSAEPQERIGAIRHTDAYNWGYDPVHYGAPEGSYSQNPHSSLRILEFRQMVQALAQIGLGTILDVVYNHTHQVDSPLNKMVPAYYYRLDRQGQIQNSSCCPDTASEHTMMEKLMVDTLVRWARDYKISGFRFDLMGHHTQGNLSAIRHALDQLNETEHGIDGRRIYLYGEGWKFGSLDNQRPDAMHQLHAAGSGIGTFNDRLRDSVRGGNFSHSTRADQGWATGLALDSNGSTEWHDTPQSADAQLALLHHYGDQVRLGLAANLRDFAWTQADGQRRTGADLPYRGHQPSGYALDPAETLNYVSAHDNYCLWDQIAAKAPFESPENGTLSSHERARMQQLAMATVLLAQGVPFLDAGSEILRSKSGDGDSYDSGDHFNALDWSYQRNGWGLGLPAAWRNQAEWPFWQARLIHPDLRPQPTEITDHLSQIEVLLKIRRSSPLFRLRSAAEIQNQLAFHATGPHTPGLIVMEIKDSPANLDPLREGLLIMLNPHKQGFYWQDPQRRPWQAHALNPLFKHSISPEGLWVPARSFSIWERH